MSWPSCRQTNPGRGTEAATLQFPRSTQILSHRRRLRRRIETTWLHGTSVKSRSGASCASQPSPQRGLLVYAYMRYVALVALLSRRRSRPASALATAAVGRKRSSGDWRCLPAACGRSRSSASGRGSRPTSASACWIAPNQLTRREAGSCNAGRGAVLMPLAAGLILLLNSDTLDRDERRTCLSWRCGSQR